MGKGPKGRAHHDGRGMLMGTSLRSFAHPTKSQDFRIQTIVINTLILLVDLPGDWDLVRVLLALLALAAFHRYILGSIRDDYQRFVRGRLHDRSLFRKVL